MDPWLSLLTQAVVSIVVTGVGGFIVSSLLPRRPSAFEETWSATEDALRLLSPNGGVRGRARVVARPDGKRRRLILCADWPHGAGPELVVGAVRGAPSWVREADPLFVEQPGLDPPLRVLAFPPTSHWILRKSFSPEIVELFGESVRSDGRTVTAVWDGEIDPRTVDRLIDALAGFVSAGLGPLEAADAMPEGEVTWPTGSREVPHATLRRNETVASLVHVHRHWRLRAEVPHGWPPFRATVVEGAAKGAWPPDVLRVVGRFLPTLGSAEIIAEERSLEIAFAGGPGARELDAGLALLVRAAGGGPESSGAFR